MHHDQCIGRLSPAHIVNDRAANGGGQVIVATAIDVGLHYSIFDDIHAVVGKAQHVAVVHRKLE